jgi:hypothetical protein
MQSLAEACSIPSKQHCIQCIFTSRCQIHWGVISVYDSKKDARNIEQGFTPSHKNVHFLRVAQAKGHQNNNTPKAKARNRVKIVIEAECDTKRVILDPRVPDKAVLIAQDLSPEEEVELLSFLDKNSDVFA